MGDPWQGGVVEKGRSQKVELPDSSGIEAAEANTNCTRLSLLQVQTLVEMSLHPVLTLASPDTCQDVSV